MGMTIAEKILAKKSGQSVVRPGQIVAVDVDIAVQSDASFGSYKTIGAEPAKVFDTEKVIITTGASAPATRIESAEVHTAQRKFVERFGIKNFFDVGRGGVIHQVLAENGLVRPGMILAAGDSHTAAAGAFNCAARALGGPEMLWVVATGKTWYLLGPTNKIVLDGELPPHVYPRDIVHHIADEFGEFVGENIEYTGPAIAKMPMGSRQTIATESVELSVEFALFEADQITADYIKARTDKPFEPVFADADAEYKSVKHVDLSKLIPKVVLPHFVPNNVRPASECGDVKITQAYVGSCANGRVEDIEAVANVVRGKKVAPGVRLIVIPSSYEQYKLAVKAGYVEDISDANGVVGAPGCGMCGGGSLGPEDVCITASPRNFQGRMGHPKALIYMGSPATVAASAITGVITDPRTMG